jgi:hypothetical protein
LEDERTPRDDSASTRQEIPADNVFQDRGLSGRLRSYYNLGSLEWLSSHI